MKNVFLAAIFFCSMLAFGASSTPVTVSSISCSAGVCTVTTASAHNVPSNNAGVCLQGGPAADVLCGIAATVPSSTTFTVNSSSMATCASSCGTAQPAKNFLISGDPITNQLGLHQVTVCIWNYILTPLPSPNKTSGCAAAETNSTLLTSENGALASGAWYETQITLTFASSDTRAQIEQEFQRIQFAIQLEIAAGIQPGRDAGTFCDAVGCNQ
jgi:hypothetical protein